MKYTAKPTQVEAIQWTGKNTAEVIAFLNEKGFPHTRMERRTDTPLFVNVKNGTLTVYKGQYIVVHADKVLSTHSEEFFLETYEPTT